MLKTQEKNTLPEVDSDVKIDFDALEKELDNSDWSRGWEQGRIDAIKAMQENFLPRNDLVLRSAEIITKIMIAHFGDVFSRVFAGFNGHYDEPAILLCMNDDAQCSRGDVIWFGVKLQPLFSEQNLVPLRVLVTKSSSTDFDTVAKDFSFERVHA